MVREAEHAESKNDFRHKMGIAQKEINEAIYWLELLKESDYLDKEQFEIINDDAVEIIKLLTTIIKTSKSNPSDRISRKLSGRAGINQLSLTPSDRIVRAGINHFLAILYNLP